MNESIFFDEWRNCLQEHYLYVLRTGDWITEKTLRDVLINVGGFSESEIQEMRAYILGEAALIEEEQPETPIPEEDIYAEEAEIYYSEEEIVAEEFPEEAPPPEEKSSRFQQGRLF